MKFERDQFSGNHGIVFNVSRFTLSASERGGLRTLHFGEAKAAHYEVSNLVVELYDKMLAKDLPCQMMVGISKPLTRLQGDLLNAQRTSIANLTSGVFAAAAGKFMPAAAIPVGWAVREFTLSTLPTYHAGDVIVSLDAQVSGGIGPQHSASSMIIKTQGG
ncbi:hypothetical protein ACIPLA_22205 [Pseudomonas sp. NPDC086112]|uniref:hypothetical protein n=1 Tax=unclassified Pseudomonas TaxID=196821 RepID=UPI0017813F30|nr:MULTISPECIES: hypothetical protein [unclassified Pseudomonas]MBD9566387.1 hypothetical protein [Pseudomonas sp. PDM09]MBV7497033.1 hypothetical protein [Pseudomonas sp. PDM24]